MVANRFALFTLLLALLCLAPGQGGIQAQKKKKMTASNNTGGNNDFKGSPEKILQLADDLYELQRYSKAKEAYQAVLMKEPQNYQATLRVAKCAFFIQEFDESAKYFQSAIELNKNGNDTAYFELGVVYRILDRHKDALEVFQEFKKRHKEKDDYAERVKLEIEGCKWVEEIRQKEPVWNTRPLDINTAAGDQLPSVMEQNEGDRYLVITSHRTESMGNEEFEGYNEVAYSDIYMAKIEDDTTFGPVESFGKPLNTKNNDGSTTFSPDGMTIYYSICNSGKLGYGCSIFESKWDARKKKWTKPKIVEELQGEKEVVVDSRGKTKKVPTYDVQPWLSTDGNTLYFVSDRDGGQGRLDIWYSTYAGEGWSKPINAGSAVNTPFDDLSPTLSEDGRTLYFASDGRIGMGGLDIYKTEGASGSWGQPTNMGLGFNSTFDDWGAMFFNQDSSAYITTNREGGDGRDDIWFAKMKPEPPCTVAVHGTVRDVKTLKAVPFATVILFIDNGEELIPVDTFKAGQTAEYNFMGECDLVYKVLGNAPEYLAAEQVFDTRNLPKDENGMIDLEVNIDIKLDRIFIAEPIALNNIYYDFDEFFLRDAAKQELDNLAKLLGKNPNITIRVGSHTDSNGSESYNKTLSENRAKEAVKYLIENGVASDRLQWFGYGESELLIYPELSDEDEQLNRRSEFRILSIDYQGR